MGSKHIQRWQEGPGRQGLGKEYEGGLMASDKRRFDEVRSLLPAATGHVQVEKPSARVRLACRLCGEPVREGAGRRVIQVEPGVWQCRPRSAKACGIQAKEKAVWDEWYTAGGTP